MIIFSTCQGEFIYNNWLKYHDYFKQFKYIYIKNYDQLNYDLNLFKDCDLFIYQPVEKIIDDILKSLKKSYIIVCFPFVYVDLWPIYEEIGKYGKNEGIYIGGEIIAKYKNNNYSLDRILKLYDNGDLNFEMEKRFNYCIQHLKNKEDKYADIFVSDFIILHYKNHRLFDTNNHFNGILGAYIFKAICRFLNLHIHDINEFLESDKHIIPLFFNDSFYMKKELELEYIMNDKGKDHYRNLIIRLYNHPELIKYKYNFY